ncbi:cell division protein ZapA [Sphingomonas sabuli]|uniref:Cell division protein ZapA n=1 Tax=Sphingomonas sabuli TaxID=2764186 RepID=A0A7G9L2S9_9SPHN|nr:cell division protein ZapA [Sphingomonas sabuli]QNM82928.1 cell division protein ZapA [Sphingomonas sabuli]
MAEVDVIIAGRPYKVGCRDGEEEQLRAAARLVDAKSREALSGLGSLSEARQLLFAGLLLADQLIDNRPQGATASVASEPAPSAPAAPDPEIACRATRLAERLESLASSLEDEAARS